MEAVKQINEGGSASSLNNMHDAADAVITKYFTDELKGKTVKLKTNDGSAIWRAQEIEISEIIYTSANKDDATDGFVYISTDGKKYNNFRTHDVTVVGHEVGTYSAEEGWTD